MDAGHYEELITKGIRGLPDDALAEIADFVYFLRKRMLEPDAFEQERAQLLLSANRKHLSRSEEAHLEQEFQDYDRLYPRE